MIEAEVRKQFNNFMLNVKFRDGGIVSIIGKNGSGKSTFLKIISGIINPDSGYVRLNGIDITTLPVNKREIVLVNQETYIPNLKVRQHLSWGAKVRKVNVGEREIEEISKILGLPVHENKKVSQLSLGNRERVALATALLSRPKVILIDEGFSNINNKREFIKDFISLCKDYKIEVIYVTQDIEDTKLSEKVYQMENGSLKLFRED